MSESSDDDLDGEAAAWAARAAPLSGTGAEPCEEFVAEAPGEGLVLVAVFAAAGRRPSWSLRPAGFPRCCVRRTPKAAGTACWTQLWDCVLDSAEEEETCRTESGDTEFILGGPVLEPAETLLASTH